MGVIYLRILIVMSILSFATVTTDSDIYLWDKPPLLNISPRPEVYYFEHQEPFYGFLQEIDMLEEIVGEVILGIFNYKGPTAPVIWQYGEKIKRLGAEIRSGVEVDGNQWYLIVKNQQDFELGVQEIEIVCQIPSDNESYFLIMVRLVNIDDNAPVITGGTCQVPDNSDSTDCVYEVTDADGYLSYYNMHVYIVPRARAAEDTIFGTDLELIEPSDGPAYMTVRLTVLVELDYDLARLFIFSIVVTDAINEGRVTAVVQITPPTPHLKTEEILINL